MLLDRGEKDREAKQRERDDVSSHLVLLRARFFGLGPSRFPR